LLPVDTAELIVSELVTNAVQASAGLTGSRYDGRWTPGTPPVRVWLCSDRQRVVAAVWDGSDRMPARTMPDDPEAERGRGLLLVETLSAEWGVHTPARSSGKVVWAVLTQ
jgi:anti-sigma regulatory factor (Ser/Thr protein kinase)